MLYYCFLPPEDGFFAYFLDRDSLSFIIIMDTFQYSPDCEALSLYLCPTDKVLICSTLLFQFIQVYKLYQFCVEI